MTHNKCKTICGYIMPNSLLSFIRNKGKSERKPFLVLYGKINSKLMGQDNRIVETLFLIVYKTEKDQVVLGDKILPKKQVKIMKKQNLPKV